MLATNEVFHQFLSNFGVESSNSHLFIYIALMLAVMVEGPVAILVGATAASSGFLNPVPVFVAASLGNLFGDLAWYLLGYSGKIEWALKLRFLHLDLRKITFLKQAIARNAVKILAIAKLTNGLIVPALIATGLTRVSLRRWFPIIFITNLVTTGIFVAIGYYTAINLLKFDHWIRYFALGFSFILLVLVSVMIRKWLSQYYSIEELLTEEKEMDSIRP